MMQARASAPASIGNVAVGFDVLGQAFDAVRDTVTATREDAPGVRLGTVTGLVATLPAEPGRNTALAAAQALLNAAGARFGVRLSIQKGVPLSAGMGGSASSAVAAAAAVNALLDPPFATQDLLGFALEGERASADPPPWDNVMASLLGGLVIAARTEPALVQRMPVPKGLVAVLLHPDARIETRHARGVLKPSVAMNIAVEHARAISAFTLGCATNDRALIRAGMEDRLVEPQRRFLLPELAAVKRAAVGAGALGCSFSGSGPSVFAWTEAGDADRVQAAMGSAFTAAGRAFTPYRAALDSPGVRLEPIEEVVA
ncbi:homoserine kinase [Marinicauda algicola]|uniref:Homoserine kinase n=1 Tax=Marinicauda algicola TaxID=2029849 RepID=A0A4S2H241_9PROT|nr:homoserine kinase [Marinicauda algicola]TGY89341.1 homoserine kinase [Marinicauda algicola]